MTVTTVATPGTVNLPARIETIVQQAGAALPATAAAATPALPQNPLPKLTVNVHNAIASLAHAVPLPQVSVVSAAPEPSTSTVTIVQQPSQQQQQDRTPEEQRILRYGKAILKLKHFRRNLKYSIWDFQDGKSLQESGIRNKIAVDAISYSIEMILKKTGQTVEQFKENKTQSCDEHPGPRSDDYMQRLRSAVLAFKQTKFGTLFHYASAGQVSLFDLVDELVKELEIESKLSRLKPVAPLQVNLPQTPVGLDQLSTSSGSEHNFVQDNDATILSDIDEVIRDDTDDAVAGPSPSASRVLPVVQSQPHQAVTVLPVNDGMEGGHVITLNICGVCQKIFTDEAAFKQHEAAGCIDFD